MATSVSTTIGSVGKSTQPKAASNIFTPQVPGTNRIYTSMVKSSVAFDRNRNLRGQVEKAIKEHKIFTCIGVYPAIRKALQARGWVEKNLSVVGTARSQNFSQSGKDFDTRSLEEESDQAWTNRVLKEYPPDFIWTIRRDNIDWRALHREQIVNRFPKAYFTTKVGIAACVQSMQWFSESGISDTFFPRCYRLCIDEEKAAFVDDYRLTACMGLLKWVVASYEKDGESGVMDQSGRVVSLAVDFAVRQVNNYVRMRRHEDIDWLMPPAFMGQHWDVFLSQYYSVVILRGKLISDGQESAKTKYEAAKRALQRLSPFWPQLNIDGTLNIWICKPGARSRGKGITIMNQLDKILELLSQSNCREANWVVQKYIERPLLIYNTKFDIRQWFIVSDWSPLTIWFYKESYIRFCTKPFSLEDFHESVHLCNNAIQCRYQNAESRDSSLPDENMWDCYTFQAYLKTQGKMDLWDSLIYPGMKQGIIGVLLASQESIDVRKNCFELYGADFMLSEDLRPWLIEINSCPCMSPSTSVTARMCAQCLEDTIKVIVDRREDRNADTGMFEMIYRQNQSVVQIPFNGLDLVVQGKKLTRDVDWPSIMTKYNSKRTSSRTSNSSRILQGNPKSNSTLEGNGLTFMDLVQRLRLKDAQGAIGNSNVMSQHPPSALHAVLNRAREAQTAALKGSSELQKNSARSNPAVHRIAIMEGKNEDKNENHNAAKKSAAATHRSTTAERLPLTSQRTARNGLNSAPPQSNTETLLSTLLKSSTTGRPTMADLVRLSKEVASDAVRVKTPPGGSGSGSQSEAKDRPKSMNSNIPSAKPTPSSRPMNPNTPIKPNARTNSNLIPPPTDEGLKTPTVCNNQIASAVNNNAGSSVQCKDGGGLGTKYGKLPTSFYKVHKISDFKFHNKLMDEKTDEFCEDHVVSLVQKLNTVPPGNELMYGRSNNRESILRLSQCSLLDDCDVWACDDKDENFSPTTDPESNFKSKPEGNVKVIVTNTGASTGQSRSSKSRGSGLKRKGLSRRSSLLRRKLLSRHPHICYRVALEHPANPNALLNKKSLISFPLKTVNLHMM